VAGVADLVFRGGPVFRADPARSWATSVAVKSGRIVAVGDDDTVASSVGVDTTVVDLDGRLLCPGFQDAHVHPRTGGRTLLTCNLSEVLTFDEAAPVVRSYVAAHSDHHWIWGGGWQFSWFPSGMPTRELLDELVPDRPAYLRVADGHAGWANSLALAVAGIVPGVPDPPGGRIERNPDGSIQGTLQEEAAMQLVEQFQVETPADVDTALLRGQEHLVSLGITAWQDAWVEPPLHDAYVRLAASGALRGSVRGSLWWDPAMELAEQLDRIVTQRRESVGRYRAGSIKLMLDGVAENFTARMLRPYLDGNGNPTGNSGMDFFDPESVPRIVTEIVRLGFQPHFHALGDAAVRAALDAVEAARRQLGWTDVRPHIAHLQVVDPADIPRFRSLGVTANLQPLWACFEEAMSDLTLPFISAETAENQYPFGALRESGATLAMGSDWSVSTPDVMWQVDVAVRREVIWDRSRPAFLPDQRLAVGDALAAFTAGSAYVNHLDPDRGIITKGAIADLVVLGGNPFLAGDISAVPVDMTVIDGEIVFER